METVIPEACGLVNSFVQDNSFNVYFGFQKIYLSL